MVPTSKPACVLPPKLVVYWDEEIVSLNLKRLGSLIPQRPGENRPPGEAVPKGIRRKDSFPEPGRPRPGRYR